MRQNDVQFYPTFLGARTLAQAQRSYSFLYYTIFWKIIPVNLSVKKVKFS